MSNQWNGITYKGSTTKFKRFVLAYIIVIFYSVYRVIPAVKLARRLME